MSDSGRRYRNRDLIGLVRVPRATIANGPLAAQTERGCCRKSPHFRFSVVPIPPDSLLGQSVMLRTEPNGLGPTGFHPYRETHPPAVDELG